MDAKLVVITGKTSKRLVPLQLPAVLGRSREADVTVAHPMISRRHCEIYEHDGLLMLRDMASLNGTMVGGRKIVLAPLLPQGEFSIGPVGFRVLYQFDGDLAAVPETEFAEYDEGLHVPTSEGRPGQTDFAAMSGFEEAVAVDADDSAAMPTPDLLAWADAEDHAPPAPSPPPTPAQSAARKAAQPVQRSPGPIPERRSAPPPPANVHPLRSLSVPQDKIPTVPAPKTMLPTVPLFEAEIAEPESPKTSPWDDGGEPIPPRAVPPPAPPKHKPPHPGHEAVDDDFGSFLEGLQ